MLNIKIDQSFIAFQRKMPSSSGSIFFSVDLQQFKVTVEGKCPPVGPARRLESEVNHE